MGKLCVIMTWSKQMLFIPHIHWTNKNWFMPYKNLFVISHVKCILYGQFYRCSWLCEYFMYPLQRRSIKYNENSNILESVQYHDKIYIIIKGILLLWNILCIIHSMAKWFLEISCANHWAWSKDFLLVEEMSAFLIAL